MTSVPLLAAAIQSLRPGAQWVLNGDSLAGLEWLDQTQTRPTDDEIIAAVGKPSVPQVISDRQFFQELAVMGVITPDDALAAVATGTLPTAMANLVAGLPAGDGTPADPNNQQFKAKMLLVGATTFDRQHPMVAVLGQSFGWNAAQLDALWTAAAAL